MGSEEAKKTPPRLCYHALPSQRREPRGMATPPLQAPGSVPFLWEVAPGRPRSSGEPNGHKAVRRLEPPPRMALLSSSSSAWQVTKVADAEVPSKNTVLEGTYYVLLPHSASLFDGPSVTARSNSLSCTSCRHYAIGDEGRRKERPAVWFWKRAVRRRSDDGISSARKKGEAAAAYFPPPFSTTGKGYDDHGQGLSVGGRGAGVCARAEAAAPATNVTITRFRRSGSLPNLSTAGTHLWASIYGGLKQAVAAPWTSRKPAGKR